MQHRALTSLLCFVLLPFLGCEKRATNQLSNSPKAPPAKNQSAPAQFDVCGLIKKEEIEAIQGSPITEMKSSTRSTGGLRITQCFYTAAEFSKSISLSVTQSDPDSAARQSPRDFWKGIFGRYEGEAKEYEGDKEKQESLREKSGGEERSIPPKKIDGIGEAAYWTGAGVSGVLNVLKNDVLIRLSVGGADDEETKINKLKAVAEKALSRL